MESAVWPFDGRTQAYFPNGKLKVASDLPLYEEYAEDVDPITFEVIRSNLWTINLEHGDVIKRSSGSPIVVYADDFNQSIHTELGDPVAFGPSIQHFTGLADLGIKWTLENRSVEKGIRDGDIFLHSDPWVGAAHQMDVTVYAPVFVEGGLFAWVLNVCHARDIGGTEPGSWVVEAPDVFHESTPIPPIRVAANDVLLHDVEEMYTRKSRYREFCALELRSQIAGVLSAKRRLTALVERYGARIVKGVMRKMLDNSERATRDRLAKLPDGTWRSEIYLGGVPRGGRGLAKIVLEMTKRGSQLSFSNAGTDAQGDAINCTAGMWRAAIFVAASAMLGYDQYLCAGGLLRCLNFLPEPGTRTSCQWPGAVSSGIHPHSVTYYQATSLISKLFACDEVAARRAMAPGGMHTILTSQYSGIAKGRAYSGSTADVMAGAIGAFSFRDGIATGGQFFVPQSRAGDVEQWEQNLPLLCLYRKEISNGGGHGRWRGGASIISAYIGHGVEHQRVASNTPATSVTAGLGLSGGLPGSGGWHRSATSSGIREILRSGRLPGDSTDLQACVPSLQTVEPFGKRRICEDDIWEEACASGAGFGDPLLRLPEKVLQDLADARTTRELAARIYGVVLAEDGSLDLAATESCRCEIRKARAAAGQHFETPYAADALKGASIVRIHPIADQIELIRADDEPYFRCRNCEHPLSRASENYKRRTPYIHLALEEIDAEQFLAPATEVDEGVALRQYICPGCSIILDSDIVKRAEPPIHDIALAL